MRYHFFQKFFGNMVKIKEMSFLSTTDMTVIFGNYVFKFLFIISLELIAKNSNVMNLLVNHCCGRELVYCFIFLVIA